MNRGGDLVQRRLVLDQRRADRGRAEAEQDEDRREARDEQQARHEHAPRAADPAARRARRRRPSRGSPGPAAARTARGTTPRRRRSPQTLQHLSPMTPPTRILEAAARAGHPARRSASGPPPRPPAARPGSPAHNGGRARADATGSASSRLATTIVGSLSERSAAQLSNGRERGTAASASATASGCSCAAIRWRSTVSTVSAPGLRQALDPVGRDEALDAALAQAARERVPVREVAGGALGVVGGRHEHQPARRSAGALERERQRGVRAHRGADHDRRGAPQRRDHRRRGRPPAPRRSSRRPLRAPMRRGRGRRRERRADPSARACASPSGRSGASR